MSRFNKYIPYISIVIAVAVLFLTIMNVSRNGTRPGCSQSPYDRDAGYLLDRGNQCVFRNDADSALFYYSLVAKRYTPEVRDSDLLVYSRAFNNLGYLYFFQYSDYSPAFDNLLASIEIAEANSLKGILPTAYLNIANVYYIYHDTRTSLDFYKKAFKTAVEENNNDMMGRALSNMILQATADTAADLTEEIRIFRSLPRKSTDDYAYLSRLVNVIDAYRQNNNELAIAEIDSAAGVAGALGERRLIGLRSMRFSLLLENGKFSEAEEELDSLEKLSLKPGNADIRSGYLLNRSELYYKSGRTDSALYYTRKYVDFNDSVFSPTSFGKLKDLQRTRSLSLASDKYHRLEVENRYTAVLAWTFGIFALIVTVALWIILRQKRNLQTRNEMLFQRNEQLLDAEEESRQWRKIYVELDRRTATPETDGTDRPVVQGEESGQPQVDEPVTDVDGNSDQMTDAERIKLTAIAQHVSDILESTPLIYDPAFNLDRLAFLAETPRPTVSLAINKILGKSFLTLLGELRVQQACARLADNEAGKKLTLEAIASECGFKSRTNFISVFKKHVGLTPSEYRRIALRKAEEMS